MRDRQLFVEHQLQNGIRIFTYEDDTPYTYIIVSVPVGSAHNMAGVTPGTFHFLEHMVMKRSQQNPGYKELKQLVGLRGGKLNAGTSWFDTCYILKISNRHLSPVLPGFFAQVFQPLWREEDIVKERGVISNERLRRARWFPAKSELGHYMNTQWRWCCPVSLRQVFGSDEDLATMTATTLNIAHQYYFDHRVWVMVGGSGRATELFEKIAALPVKEHTLSHQVDPVRWVKQDYHTKAFRDVSRFQLRVGGFVVPRPEPLMIQALQFILGYLINPIHGPLFRWLREEKGWVYELSSANKVDRYSNEWTLFFPLASMTQVAKVREELSEKVAAALSNAEGINLEVERLQGELDTFYWLTLGQIMENAQRHLENYGRIITETELRSNLERMRDPTFLQKVWQQYYASDRIGSFCATPLEE